MPVYNERATLREALDRLLAVEMPVPTEVLVVDDGSTDGCTDTIADLVESGAVRLIRQDPNQGKGAALRRGIAEAEGELLTILDADLEYDPRDLPELVAPILGGDAKVVYGARSYGGHAAYSFWFVMGNKMLALWASFLFDAWLTDIETCLKVAPTATWRAVDLRSDGFGIEAELTGKLLARKERIFEVPIRYKARGRDEGKKIQWTDGVAALWILLRIRLRGR
ncbi:MAG: glycosyltransferase family 2 protein [Actinobacteria bacterium]|nr:glycosyltransferase family 2 protein [Actinomycetota bacterium]